MYSFEQLKIFVTVCETGSFSAAARKLKRAQSGVSQSVANLEIAINQELFNREKNTPTLTDSGKALLPIAQSILHQQKFFDQKVESLEQAYEHELVIAVDESLINQSLLAQFASLADQFPITQFDIITAPTFDVEELIRNGKAQVGIVLADGELKMDMDFFTLGHTRFLTVLRLLTHWHSYRWFMMRSSKPIANWYCAAHKGKSCGSVTPSALSYGLLIRIRR